jgi:hypothetical protein
MIYYILKKDLPDSKVGDMFIWNESQRAYYKDGNVLGSYWTAEYVEGNTEWFEKFETVDKPPLGLIPLWLHREQRRNDLLAAMHRYIKVGKIIPDEWRDELIELNTLLNQRYNTP